MSRDDPLELATRRRLFHEVSAHPGLHLRELDRRTGLGVGALRYHLTELEKAQLVSKADMSGHARYFALDVRLDERALISALRPRLHRRIVLYLLVHGPAAQVDVARGLTVPATTISRRVRVLAELRVIEKDGTTRLIRVAQQERVVRVLVAYKRSFADRLADAALEMWLDYL